MSIPANVVLGGDLDTIGRLRSGRFDDPFMPSMDRPYGEGLLLVIPPYRQFGSITYDVPMDMELHRVHFDTNKYTTSDDWNLYLNEDVEKNYIIRNFSQKNFTEGIQLMSVIKLKKGDKLTFSLKNTSFGTGIRAEISMLFLTDGKKLNSSSTGSTGDVDYMTLGVHVNYNLFGEGFGNPISGTSLYDEATPFVIKQGKDHNTLLDMTGEHKDFVPEGRSIKSIIHNLPRVVKIVYKKQDGTEETLQLKKNYSYVAVPDEVFSNGTDRVEFLNNVKDKLEMYMTGKNLPNVVRGIRESDLQRVVKITIT